MRNDKIYIAGPMSGLSDFNFPAFDQAEQQLKSSGWKHILNPACLGRIYGLDKTHTFYMEHALNMLMKCGNIMMLPGWEKSKGASLEFAVAKATGITVMYYTAEVAKEPTEPEAPITETESSSYEPVFRTNPIDSRTTLCQHPIDKYCFRCCNGFFANEAARNCSN